MISNTFKIKEKIKIVFFKYVPKRETNLRLFHHHLDTLTSMYCVPINYFQLSHFL